jgi:hypothetical protein
MTGCVAVKIASDAKTAGKSPVIEQVCEAGTAGFSNLMWEFPQRGELFSHTWAVKAQAK